MQSKKGRWGVPAAARWTSFVLLIAVSWCAARPALAGPPRRVVHAAQADLGAVVRQLPNHGSLRVEGVPFEGATTALELERFEVFTPDAQIVSAGDHGDIVLPAPDNAYFRGAVEGDLGAVAVLTARAKGGVRGLIVKDGVPWIISDEPGPKRLPGLSTRQVDLAHEFAGHPFRCGADDGLQTPAALDPPPAGLAEPAEPVAAGTTVNYTARVAVETDYEFFQLFNSTTDATDYVGDLFAYASTIYESEINTSLVISYLKLWTTSDDPWSQTSCSSVLTEFRNYWNQKNSGISRTTAHMLSGRPTGCGIAYIGGLCNKSYGYGVSGGLSGSFNIQNPGVVWDILVVSHEIGHNFNSPHTHCYNGIGGSTQPVDQCYSGESGCYSGATSLPCSLGGGHGCGTIMSYCHLLDGGYGNISMSFGTGFPYGTLPGRVPTRMHDYVVSTAASDPSCLQYVPPGPNPTPIIAITPTATPVTTATRTATGTPTSVPTFTRTATLPPTLTAVPSNTAASTPTPTRTNSPGPTSTRTPTSSPPATFTATPVPTGTVTPVPPLQLVAVQDAWIDQANQTQNMGNDASLRVLPETPKLRRTLVRFDLSAIPAAACVSSATLRLTLTAVQKPARTFAIHRLTHAWTEGTGVSNSGVTWARGDGVPPWTAPGGDFVATATAAVSSGTTNGVMLQWNVTADVAAFLAGTAPNYGWLVKDGSESKGKGKEFRFASRETSTTSSRPQLQITFTPCP